MLQYSRGGEEMNISELTGKVITSISGLEKESEEVLFTLTDGRKFKLYHLKDCCEEVKVAEVHGDVDDLIGNPILFAEESISENNENEKPEPYSDSWTWTFYRLTTIKGSVVIRWLGESNGYYSESVDFCEVVE
jgi:hypothetical protein